MTGPEKHQPYPKYLPSGIEWLGEIPEHWQVKRLKFSVNGCQNGLWGDEPTGSSDDIICVRVADFDRTHHRVSLEKRTLRSVSLSQHSGKVLERGDLLLEKSGGGSSQPVGAVVLYDFDELAVCSNFVARMPVRREHHAKYFCYLHSVLYAAGINTRSIKQNTGIQNLDAEAYLSEPVAFPPLEEQRAIADFLDRETAKLDALVAAKERLVVLIRERRTTMISQAVTRGLY